MGRGPRAGSLYRYRLDGDKNIPIPPPIPARGTARPVPGGRSRMLSAGDHGWKGLKLEGQVFYELHVGTFTPEGTWAAAADRLSRLVELGITAVEVMPVAEFAGTFGWGYDGVDFYAPYHHYGSPDDMRRFVDRGPRPGAGRDPRRRLQPLRPRWLLSPRLLGSLHAQEPAGQRLGRCTQLRRPGERARPRILHRQRGLLDLGIRRVPPRRAPARRDASDPRRFGGAHPRGDQPTRPGRGRANGRSCSSPRMSPRTSRLVRSADRTGLWAGCRLE